MTDDKITLFYCPQTRATGTRFILEELGLPYDLHVMNRNRGVNHQPAYLAINPLGKVPAIQHRGTIVTEQAAICLYLAELVPGNTWAPVIGDPMRGTYLRFAMFYHACFEPALIDLSLKRDPAPRSQSPYGDYAEVIAILEDQLTRNSFIAGDTITALDLLWGTAFHWTMMFGLVPEKAVFRDYCAMITDRPSYVRIGAEDDKMAAEHKRQAEAAE